MKKGTNSSNVSKSPGIIDPYPHQSHRASTYHPIPENKEHAIEVLADVFGGGSWKVVDGQREERTGVISPVSENKVAVDFRIEIY